MGVEEAVLVNLEFASSWKRHFRRTENKPVKFEVYSIKWRKKNTNFTVYSAASTDLHPLHFRGLLIARDWKKLTEAVKSNIP